VKTWRSGALLALLVLAGCNQILGIEVQEQSDAGDEPDGGSGPDGEGDGGEIKYESPSEGECSEYCKLLDQSCNPMTGNAAFGQSSYCPGVCSQMQRKAMTGNTFDKTGNTFDCRLQQANLARAVGTIDNSTECKAAGAGGNDECGSNCEGYCQLYASVCAAFPDLQRGDSCLSECEALAVDTTKNAAASFSSGADTLQCRLAHMGAASISAETAMTHCPHAAIIAASGTPCQPTIPSCDQYCELLTNTCTGKLLQYDSEGDCLATCKGGLTLNEPLAPGETSDQTHDTVACRRYHTYNALQNPGSTHCQHAGPSGDGHCGHICPAYCKLAKAACGTQFATKYPKGEPDCLDDCGNNLLKTTVLTEQLDENYNVPNAKKPGTVNCRIYHASKAFRNAAAASAECPSVLGDGDCAP
jgi:hypothetical protein